MDDDPELDEVALADEDEEDADDEEADEGDPSSAEKRNLFFIFCIFPFPLLFYIESFFWKGICFLHGGRRSTRKKDGNNSSSRVVKENGLGHKEAGLNGGGGYFSSGLGGALCFWQKRVVLIGKGIFATNGLFAATG